MERSVSQDDYPQYIDVESFAKWALAQDILGVRDYYGTNMFLMKDGINIDEKIRMGILWDFDTIMELRNMWAGVHYASFSFIRQLFINPWCTDFVSAYRRCWNNVVDDRVIESLMDSLHTYAESAHATGAGHIEMLAPQLTNKGRAYIATNPSLNNPTIWDDKKYIINTIISVLALVVAIIALIK